MMNLHSLLLCLVLLATIIPSIRANTCGGNCPSNSCGACPCGTTPSHVDVAAACQRFNGWNQACCQCIVNRESGGNIHAMNQNVGGSYDVGLWQINSINWASWCRIRTWSNGGQAPCDLNSNLNCAIKVWGWGGNSFRLWATCGACGCC